MKSKAITGLVLTLFLIGMLSLAFNIQPVKASGTIYIRANGNIDPPTANITSFDNVTYTFTGNINDSIVVERDNIVVDGAGYTVQGTGAYPSKGIDLSGRSNVTIKNMEIKVFYCGIWLYRSSNNSISGNNITNNSYGIYFYESSNNVLRSNTMANNKYNFGVWGAILPHFVNDVDVSNTVDGKPIYYWVNERDKVVPLNAGYVALVNCTRITVQNLNLTTNRQGVLLAYTTNSTITKNNITNNMVGIALYYSSNYNSISGNNITNNGKGIYLYYSSNYNSIVGNNIINNDYGIQLRNSKKNYISNATIMSKVHGIHLLYSNENTIENSVMNSNGNDGIQIVSSSANTIRDNTIFDNYFGVILDSETTGNIVENNKIRDNDEGIWLSSSSLINPTNNTFRGNTLTNNSVGVNIDQDGGNIFYHNNFLNNKVQAGSSSWYVPSNIWDNGAEGNYWSNYKGQDLNGDGIGDTTFSVETNNVDRYPLIGMFSEFPVAHQEKMYHISTICNSTISDFQFNGTEICFNVSSEDGTVGFCRICIPTALMNGTYKVFVNGTEVSYTLLPCSNSTHNYLYFTYNHSTQEVVIVPEFPTWTSILLILTVLTVAIAIYKRRLLKTPIH